MGKTTGGGDGLPGAMGSSLLRMQGPRCCKVSSSNQQ